MRFSWILIASTAALILAANSPLPAATQGTASVIPAVAAVTMVAQDAQPQPPRGGDVDITIGVEDGTQWYANPIWVAIGLLAVVVVALIIGMVARGGGGGGGDTIVK